MRNRFNSGAWGNRTSGSNVRVITNSKGNGVKSPRVVQGGRSKSSRGSKGSKSSIWLRDLLSGGHDYFMEQMQRDQHNLHIEQMQRDQQAMIDQQVLIDQHMERESLSLLDPFTHVGIDAVIDHDYHGIDNGL